MRHDGYRNSVIRTIRRKLESCYRRGAAINHTETYLKETAEIAAKIDHADVELIANTIASLRGSGRLFIIGLGGSAANASHAASDFVNLCGINAICLSDSIAEFTATANDQGWENAYQRMLVRRGAGQADALLVLSVGGGTDEVSLPLVRAIEYAINRDLANMAVLGIAGRDGGFLAKHAQHCVIVPNVNPSRVTPHTEGWQSVIIHLLVSHPKLQLTKTKW